MILYLGNKLSAHGYTPTSVETLGPKLQELGFTVVLKSDRHNRVLRLLDMLGAVWKYRKKKPVVLIDTYSTSAFWFAYAIGRMCAWLRLNYIPILRGGSLPDRLEASPMACKKLFGRSFANVAVSDFLLHAFQQKGFHALCLHNYLDLEKYPVRRRGPLQPKILWVRAFHKIYNPAMALGVFKKVAERYPGFTFSMVGPDKDGSLDACRKLAEALHVPVTFTGKLSKEEWIGYSASFDLFINTTNVDNAPISLMEAMALGFPVVTTDAGGIPFLVTHEADGLVVAAGDEAQMTAAVCRLLDDAALAQKLSSAARARATAWSWTEVSEKWKQLIRKAEGA